MMSGKRKEKASERQRSGSDGELLSNKEEERGNEDEKRRKTWANLGRMPNFRKAPIVEAPTNGEEEPAVESESHRLEREQERERRNMDRRTNWSDADLDGHKDESADQGGCSSDSANGIMIADPKVKADAKERASKFCIFTRALSSKKNR
ncbi:hypothetical protein EYC80_001285 [Monilinia laxa]|nr:hypothetical protein EYC80_001285 [Monilinia laxa]